MLEIKQRCIQMNGWQGNSWSTAHHLPIVKAFQSLSFRGNRGYSNTFITAKHKQKPKKVKISGGILRRVCEDGETRYALVQGRETGKWSFPKGHSNEYELPLECCLREIAEETSIDALPMPSEYHQIGYGEYYVFDMREQPPLIPRDTKEIQNTKWVTLEEMGELNLNADATLYRKSLLNSKDDNVKR